MEDLLSRIASAYHTQKDLFAFLRDFLRLADFTRLQVNHLSNASYGGQGVAQRCQPLAMHIGQDINGPIYKYSAMT